MQKKLGKLGALFLAASVLVSTLAGCSAQDSKKKDSPQEQSTGKGRYVETQMTLPEGINSSDINFIGKKDDTIYFLSSKNENEKTKFQEFTLDKSTGIFQETTSEWLKQIQVPYWEYGTNNLIYNKDKAYLYSIYYEDDGELYRAHMFTSEDGTTPTEITPKEWEVLQEEYMYYETPTSIAITPDNILLAQYYDRIDTYNIADSSLTATLPLKEAYNNGIICKDKQFYLIKGEQSGYIKGIDAYSVDNQAEPVSIPLEMKNTTLAKMDILEDGKMIVCSKQGFLERKTESSEWNEIIPGSYTSMMLVDVWCKGMVALEDGSFYTLLESENQEPSIMEYKYDPDMEIKATTTLKIYTINPSSVLEQAAALYQKNHPEVKIEIETVLSYEEMYMGTADMNSITSNLNTKLLSGEGPDILIMDKLDMDSFIEKGLLVDIDELVSSLEESGEVLSNITSSYKGEDGKRYVIPLRFNLTLLIGKGIDATASKDLETLTKAVVDSEKNVLGPRTAEDLTSMFAPFFLREVIQGKELNKEALVKYLGYLQELGKAGGMVKEYDDNTRGWNIWDIAAEAQACFALDEGFKQAMLPLSGVKLVNGTYDVFENTFFPTFEAGIFSKSEQQEIAMDFLKFAVSKEVQNSDFYDGYPINKASMEYQSKSDRKDAEAYTMMSLPDGSSIEFAIEAYEEKEANRLMELAGQVNKRAYTDSVVETEIANVLPQLIDGSMTTQQAADKVEGALKMYLAE